jgi:hypothetical protein
MPTSLNCKFCGKPIDAKDINIQQLIAKCPYCDSVFPFETADLHEENASNNNKQKKATTKKVKDLTLPKGISMEQGFDELVFTISWRQTRNFAFFLVFSLFWNAVVLPFVVIALQQNSWQMILFLSVHLIIGISMGLYTIAILINKTLIRVSNLGIDIKIGPIPVPFNPSLFLSSNDIKQLYVEEYVPSRTNGKPDLTYAVRAIQQSGDEMRLVSGFNHPQHALFLEQEIERFLHIVDEA